MAMENHHFDWRNSLFNYFDWAIFNSKLLTQPEANCYNQNLHQSLLKIPLERSLSQHGSSGRSGRHEGGRCLLGDR
jgi:hypothetical protein